ncbi:MBL fold metallo-hydrolase, partial [Winkia sp. UMB10116]
MQIKCLTVGALQANCYIINQEGSSQALLLDPGSEADRIIAYLEDQGLELEAILLTHGHCDHIGALEAIRQYSQAAVY